MLPEGITPTVEQVAADVALALKEDLGEGDVTAQLICEQSCSHVQVVCREAAVLCGSAWFEQAFRQLDPSVRIDWHYQDGDRVPAGAVLCHLQGATRALLSAERTALNFLQTLSGTATLTALHVAQLAGTGARLLDTRKTIPGLRVAQKYAVRCGGGSNHRIGLFDAILIKENHILAAGSITAAVRQAFEHASPGMEVEVEVENSDELREALHAGARRILLDNFSLDSLREAVAINAGRARLEASGGVTLQTLRAIAETGVDDISLGGLTKDVRAIDLSMRFL